MIIRTGWVGLGALVIALTCQGSARGQTTHQHKDSGNYVVKRAYTHKRLTIQCGRGAPSTGKVHCQRVTFVTKTGLHGELQATIEADLNADATTMKGTWRLVDQDKKDWRGTFNATKRSNADARTHGTCSRSPR